MYGSGMTHKHDQAIASATWIIQHNLGVKAPIVDIWTTVGGNLVKIMPKKVEFVNLNTCRVLFNSAQTGTAIIA